MVFELNEITSLKTNELFSVDMLLFVASFVFALESRLWETLFEELVGKILKLRGKLCLFYFSCFCSGGGFCPVSVFFFFFSILPLKSRICWTWKCKVKLHLLFFFSSLESLVGLSSGRFGSVSEAVDASKCLLEVLETGKLRATTHSEQKTGLSFSWDPPSDVIPAHHRRSLDISGGFWWFFVGVFSLSLSALNCC